MSHDTHTPFQSIISEVHDPHIMLEGDTERPEAQEEEGEEGGQGKGIWEGEVTIEEERKDEGEAID